jgi:hypothetical protein
MSLKKIDTATDQRRLGITKYKAAWMGSQNRKRTLIEKLVKSE